MIYYRDFCCRREICFVEKGFVSHFVDIPVIKCAEMKRGCAGDLAVKRSITASDVKVEKRMNIVTRAR